MPGYRSTCTEATQPRSPRSPRSPLLWEACAARPHRSPFSSEVCGGGDFPDVPQTLSSHQLSPLGDRPLWDFEVLTHGGDWGGGQQVSETVVRVSAHGTGRGTGWWVMPCWLRVTRPLPAPERRRTEERATLAPAAPRATAAVRPSSPQSPHRARGGAGPPAWTVNVERERRAGAEQPCLPRPSGPPSLLSASALGLSSPSGVRPSGCRSYPALC